MHSSQADYQIVNWNSATDSVDEIHNLMVEYLGPACTREWCEYKFTSPSLPAFATLAKLNGKAVGIAAAGIQPFCSGIQRTMGTFSLTNFVSKEHRGRGLYTQLLVELSSQARRFGVSFMLTMPSSVSMPGFTKAGYKQIGTCRESVTPLGMSSGVRLLGSVRELGTFRPSLAFAQPTSHELNRFNDIANESPNIYTTLSSSYLEYRLSSKRGSAYTVDTMGGVVAILMHGYRGKLRETRILATCPRDIGNFTLEQLGRHIASKYHSDILTCRFSAPQSPRLSIGGRTLTRRANPPLLVKTTWPESSLDPELIRLTGIDTQTW